MTSVRRRLLWLLLATLLLAFLLVVSRQGAGTLGGLLSRHFDSLAFEATFLVIAGVLAAVTFYERFVQAITAALLWVGVALALIVGYSYRFELTSVADRVLTELVPGHVVTHGRTVEVARVASGDFNMTAQINGAPIAIVLDTGASSVVLTHDAARAAGLPLEVLAYTADIDTANGHTRAAPVTLDRVAIGGLVEHSVLALVAQPGQLKTSLLGMSFLNRLQSWEVRGDRLLLRGYP